MITIEMFPAGNGDTLLVALDDTYILIDGGYTSTYRDHLKPRLLELRRAGKRLSKFVITHIDADHITGALAFLEENGHADNPTIIGIDEVWFNSYRHLQFDEKQHGTLDNRPALPGKKALKSNEADSGDGLVSFEQGTSLGHLLLENKYAWNKSFDNHGVMISSNIMNFQVGDVQFTLIGPTEKALDNLGKAWRQELQKLFPGHINEDTFFDDAFESMTLAAHQDENQESHTSAERLVASATDWIESESKIWDDEDTSLPNGSSITFLIEYKGKKLLFLGDAIPGHVLAQLKNLTNEKYPLKVDVLKVAHHGAWPNNNPKLFDFIHASHYLISTNGLRHHHPDLATLSSLVKSHGHSLTKNLIFNYRQPNRLQNIDAPELRTKYNFTCLWPDVNEFGMGKNGYVKLELA